MINVAPEVRFSLLETEDQESAFAENSERWVLFPVEFEGLFSMYKKHMSFFWAPQDYNLKPLLSLQPHATTHTHTNSHTHTHMQPRTDPLKAALSFFSHLCAAQLELLGSAANEHFDDEELMRSSHRRANHGLPDILLVTASLTDRLQSAEGRAFLGFQGSFDSFAREIFTILCAQTNESPYTHPTQSTHPAHSTDYAHPSETVDGARNLKRTCNEHPDAKKARNQESPKRSSDLDREKERKEEKEKEKEKETDVNNILLSQSSQSSHESEGESRADGLDRQRWVNRHIEGLVEGRNTSLHRAPLAEVLLALTVYKAIFFASLDFCVQLAAAVFHDVLPAANQLNQLNKHNQLKQLKQLEGSEGRGGDGGKEGGKSRSSNEPESDVGKAIQEMIKCLSKLRETTWMHADFVALLLCSLAHKLDFKVAKSLVAEAIDIEAKTMARIARQCGFDLELPLEMATGGEGRDEGRKHERASGGVSASQQYQLHLLTIGERTLLSFGCSSEDNDCNFNGGTSRSRWPIPPIPPEIKNYDASTFYVKQVVAAPETHKLDQFSVSEEF